MDLNNLITTIVSSTAGIVAIIGGFLVSRVISLSNDQGFLKRKLDDLNLNIKSKEELLVSINDYLFEDDLNDFVTVSNMQLLLKNYSLEEIIEEDEYTLLSKEELEPHFNVLSEIKEEVFEFYHDEAFTKDGFKELIQQQKIKHPERSDWYEVMLDALVKNYTSKDPWLFTPPTFPTITDSSYYKEKVKQKDQLSYEIRVLNSQKEEQEKAIKNDLETTWIWPGIGVLIYSSIVGILYPATLLPYPQDYYNDEQTKLLLLVLFGSSLILLFTYLIVAIYKITNFKTKNKISK